MTRFLMTTMMAMALGATCAGEVKRNLETVRGYITKTAHKAIVEIGKKEGGDKFLKKFLADQDWMEAFAGSGRVGGTAHKFRTYDDALKALDLLVWNDKDGFIDTPLGRRIATAFALNHGGDWSDLKLVQYMECYREWAKNGTLDDSCKDLDTWGWREVVTMGQNSPLPVENLRWIHNYATLPPARYSGVCWTCCYRLFNCFGASVHGPMYYAPWEHRWNTEELRYRVGGVCGALSKFGSHCAEAHGVRSFTAGQPGHCAFLLWDFPTDRWGISYAVTSHTEPHFSLGGKGFPAIEEQDRYYRNPKRMDAEFLRWKGDYEGAMRLVPGNWNAAQDWADELEAKPSAKDAWAKFGACVLATFKDHPCQGWQLYFRFLKALGDKTALKTKAAKAALATFREPPEKTVESMYYDEKVMTPLAACFEKEREALWELVPSALEGQAKSRTYYNSIIKWASENMMGTPVETKRILRIFAASAEKTGHELDYSDMILTACAQEDHASFNHVYTLIGKISPKLLPKTTSKKYPESDFGGALISATALIKVSKTTDNNNPILYRYALSPDDFVGEHGFIAHRDKHPYADIVLAGESEINGFTIVNSGHNGSERLQVPMEISISLDGKDFKIIHTLEAVDSEWRIQLPAPVKAKYIRLQPIRNEKEDGKFFHLHKVLVYGRKLY